MKQLSLFGEREPAPVATADELLLETIFRTNGLWDDWAGSLERLAAGLGYDGERLQRKKWIARAIEETGKIEWVLAAIERLNGNRDV